MVKNNDKRGGKKDEEKESNPSTLPVDDQQECPPEGVGDELESAEQAKSSSSTTSSGNTAESGNSKTLQIPSEESSEHGQIPPRGSAFSSPAKTSSRDSPNLSPKMDLLTVKDKKRDRSASPKRGAMAFFKDLFTSKSKSPNRSPCPDCECKDKSNHRPMCPAIEKEEELASFGDKLAEQNPGQSTEDPSRTPKKRKNLLQVMDPRSPKKTKDELSKSSDSKCSCRNKAEHEKGCPFREEKEAEIKSSTDKSKNTSLTESGLSSSSSLYRKDVGAFSENSTSSSSKSSSCTGTIPKVRQQDKSEKSPNRSKKDTSSSSDATVNDPTAGTLRVPERKYGSDREAGPSRRSRTVARRKSLSPCNCSAKGKTAGHQIGCKQMNDVRRRRKEKSYSPSARRRYTDKEEEEEEKEEEEEEEE